MIAAIRQLGHGSKEALYERLFVSNHDFSLAQAYAKHLIKKGWHSAPYERRGSVYMQQSAFTTSLVVSYSRPFTRGKGWPMFPAEFIQYDVQATKLHKRIIDLRNQVYAHSDSSSYSIRPFKMSTNVWSDIIGMPFLKLAKEDCELVIGMIDSIRIPLKPKLDELKKELAR